MPIERNPLQPINNRVQTGLAHEDNQAISNTASHQTAWLLTGQAVSQPQTGTTATRTFVVASSADEDNVNGLIKELRDRSCRVVFLRLPYNDLDSQARGIIRRAKQENPDMQLVLCHSINNRRCSITDVMDAIYDRFLPEASSILRMENVGVIVHDYKNQDDRYLDSQLESMRKYQQTAFNTATCVQLTNRLDSKADSKSIKSINRAVNSILADMKPFQKSEQDIGQPECSIL